MQSDKTNEANTVWINLVNKLIINFSIHKMEIEDTKAGAELHEKMRKANPMMETSKLGKMSPDELKNHVNALNDHYKKLKEYNLSLKVKLFHS